ncbi:MAG: hypothetical protein QM710_11665 [Flavobacterium sp.]
MKKIIYAALMIIAPFTGAHSQTNAKESKGDKDYEKYAYIDVIKTYERLYEKGYQSPEMLLKLGNAYYFNAELEKAAKWYGELYASSPEQEAEFYFRYSQSLRAVKDYAKADEMMKKFDSKSGNDTRFSVI